MSTSITSPFNDAAAASTAQPPPPSSDSSSVVIVIIIIASAVIASAAIYLLLRFFSNRTMSVTDDDVVLRHGSDQCHVAQTRLLDALPLFTFGSVTGNLSGGDCAVCLSKFEPYDQLRLLPVCCHAFHADCIDAWIVSNQNCPLCRSTVLIPTDDVLHKILQTENSGNGIGSSRNANANSGSFRIEIGNISRRRSGASVVVPVDGDRRRSYSIGSFDYILDGNGYEIPVASTTHSRGASVDKESSVGIPPPGDVLASEVSGGRNWLREYVDRLAISSRAMSFGSGRFFSGSSRRSDSIVAGEDLESNRVGEEISELFRWLSGV